MDLRRKPALLVAAALVAVAAGGCAAGGTDGVPTFEVDGLWPQPLEYPYILGPVSGLTIAPNGNILAVTRQDGFSQINEVNSVTGTGDCCTPTQAVLEYAPDGSLVAEWGGPDQGYPWPDRPHGIGVDPDGNIWIGGGVATPTGGFGGGGGGPPTYDTHILKFSRDGQHLMTIGDVGAELDNTSTSSFGGPARFSFDGGEVYVADGHANNRVVVLDGETGEVLRMWGAYGNEADNSELAEYDPMADVTTYQQFRSVTCAVVIDDLVYVCDRGNNRIQVFETDGTFVEETQIAPSTLGDGSVWDIAASPDENFLYVADGSNERVYIVDRGTLAVQTSFGVGGRYPGHFLEVGSVAVDDAGNVYTAEDGQGRRVQKFVYLGNGPVTAEHQGALYPGGM